MTIVLNDVASPNNTSVMNSNFQKIEDYLNDNVLNREITDEQQANEMVTHLDMNTQKIVNIPDGVDRQDAASVGQMEDFQDTIQDGEDGYTPVKGIDYFDGADGAPGADGDPGPQGEPGVDGEDGADGTGSGIVLSVVAGTNVTVDDTDPANPIVSSTDTLPNKVDIAAFIGGVPTDAQKLVTYIVNTAFSLPVGLTASNAYAEVVSTAAATIDVQKNGVSIGSINFALGANVATFTFTTLTSFASGDRLQLINQGTADATLADVSISIRGDL